MELVSIDSSQPLPDDIITANLAKRQELNGAKHLVPGAPLLTPTVKT